MGIHFDALVDCVRKSLDPKDTGLPDQLTDVTAPTTQSYLEQVIRRAAVYHFDIAAVDLFPRSGMDKKEYHDYIRNYLALSAENGHACFMPYPITAIEDSDSVVIMDPVEENIYLMTTYERHANEGELLTVSPVALNPPVENKFPIGCTEEFFVLTRQNRKVHAVRSRPDIELEHSVHSAVAFVEELVYIMDPTTFIVEERPIQAKEKKKRNKNGRLCLLKTAARPHFLVRTEEEATTMIKRGTTGVKPHPVAGYWKTLTSPVWKEARGRRIPVSQYWRGEGVVAFEGRVYEVHVKKGLVRPVPFSQLRD